MTHKVHKSRLIEVNGTIISEFGTEGFTATFPNNSVAYSNSGMASATVQNKAGGEREMTFNVYVGSGDYKLFINLIENKNYDFIVKDTVTYTDNTSEVWTMSHCHVEKLPDRAFKPRDQDDAELTATFTVRAMKTTFASL